jgi:hypothetical protein
MFDDEADRLAAGEEEPEESPERLLAEAETSRQIADLLRRHDAGSLGALIERWNKQSKT